MYHKCTLGYERRNLEPGATVPAMGHRYDTKQFQIIDDITVSVLSSLATFRECILLFCPRWAMSW